MISSVILIQGENVNADKVTYMSLANAKQLFMGDAPQFGILLHISATTATDLNIALEQFAAVEGVTGVMTLAIKPV